MNRPFLASVTAFAACFAGLNARAIAAGSHVKASMIADVSAIVPAKPFTVGVLLTIDPQWHIYWTNPGDSGLATSVKFKLPAGFTIAPDPYPVPRKITQPGNEVVYGYENSVLITARVTPPPDAHVGDEVAISAAASWLVCKEACIPGKATSSLTIKIAEHAEPSNAATFEKEGSTVVPDSHASPDVTDVHAAIGSSSPARSITVRWKNPVSDVELFPGADDAVTVTDITVGKTDNGSMSISLNVKLLAGQKPSADHLPVLIAYRDGKGRLRGFETSVPLK